PRTCAEPRPRASPVGHSRRAACSPPRWSGCGGGEGTGSGGPPMVLSSSAVEVALPRVTRIPLPTDERAESRLVAAARAGDSGAYAQLVARHQAVAFRV